MRRKRPEDCPVRHSRRLFPASPPWARVLAGLGLLVATTVGPAAAQRGARWQLGGGLVGGLVVGSSSDYLDAGIGPELGVLYSVHRGGVMSLRADVTYLPLTGSNALLTSMVGVQAEFPSGSVRPYVSTEGGLGTNFRTAEGTGSTSSAMSWSLGAGLRFDLSDRPVCLDLGGSFVRSGPLDFSTDSGLLHDDVGVLMIRAGVSIGLR